MKGFGVSDGEMWGGVPKADDVCGLPGQEWESFWPKRFWVLRLRKFEAEEI